MTRRHFLAAATVGMIPTSLQVKPPLVIPVHIILDQAAKLGPHQLHFFWAYLWPQAASELAACGIRFEVSQAEGEVGRPPGREPTVSGLERGALNLVVTNRIPMDWDVGRGLSGVTTLYRSYHLCMVALERAHLNQIPFLSLNTCLHEMLHALLHDIFESRPRGASGQFRELRIDWYATGLWLFHDGDAVRKAAESYVTRLRSA